MKNLSKTTKSIMFAAILSAIIIPTSIMQIDALPDNGNNKALAEVEELKKVAEPYVTAKNDLKQAQNQVSLMTEYGNGTATEISQLNTDIQKLEIDIANYKTELDQMEQERMERYKIAPELESKLRAAQEDAKNSDLPLIGISVSGLHQSLVITVDENQLTEEKGEAYYTKEIKSMYNDLPVKVRFGTAVDASCTTPTSNCDPLIGGIKMEGKNHGTCSIGLAIDRNGVEGFITAGHCVDNTSGSGDDVFQPYEDWLGWNKVGDVTVDLYQAECDCAWVDQSSGDTNTQAVWSATNSWTTVDTFTDRSTGGENIMVHGATSTLDYGVVDDPNDTVYINSIWFDVVSTTTVVMQSGDSGGAITDLDENDFHGIVKAYSSSQSFYIPWENVADATNGLDL